MSGQEDTSYKLMLLAVNFIFMITGIVLLTIGIVIPTSYNDYKYFVPLQFFDLPAFCVATAAITFIFAIVVGFVAVLKDNYILRKVYFVAMIVTFIFQVFASVAGFFLCNNAQAIIRQQMTYSMGTYGSDLSPATKIWDTIQRNFGCCGIDDPRNWLRYLNTEDTQGLPLSCCNLHIGAVYSYNYTCTTLTSYDRGCYYALGEFVGDQMLSIGVTGAVIAVIQALLIIFTFRAVTLARAEQVANAQFTKEQMAVSISMYEKKDYGAIKNQILKKEMQ